MVINGYGLIHAASISRVVLSFQKRSIPCSTGTRMRRSATPICPMCNSTTTSTCSAVATVRLMNFDKVNGLRGAGLYKSCWHQDSSGFFHAGGLTWVTGERFGQWFQLRLGLKDGVVTKQPPLPRRCLGHLEERRQE